MRGNKPPVLLGAKKASSKAKNGELYASRILLELSYKIEPTKTRKILTHLWVAVRVML
jgi:hypothetical protein